MRMFKVIKKIDNKILGSANIGDILYLKNTELYNSYNERVCDLESEIQEKYTLEIYK